MDGKESIGRTKAKRMSTQRLEDLVRSDKHAFVQDGALGMGEKHVTSTAAPGKSTYKHTKS
jgi:hypothetical protein